jgi:hypothetical protein
MPGQFGFGVCPELAPRRENEQRRRKGAGPGQLAGAVAIARDAAGEASPAHAGAPTKARETSAALSLESQTQHQASSAGGAIARSRRPATLLLRRRSPSQLARGADALGGPRRLRRRMREPWPPAGAQEAGRARRHAPCSARALRSAPRPGAAWNVRIIKYGLDGVAELVATRRAHRSCWPASRSKAGRDARPTRPARGPGYRARGPPAHPGRPGAVPRAAARRSTGAAGVPSPDGARRRPLQQTASSVRESPEPAAPSTRAVSGSRWSFVTCECQRGGRS